MQPEIDLGEKLKNRIFAPTGRKEKQAGLGQKAQIEENPPKPRRKKQAGFGEKLKNRIFAPTKRREKQVGVKKQKKEELLQERNKITKIKISGGKSTWIL